MKKDNQNNRKGFQIPSDVLKFAKANYKKFKKKNEDVYDGKKEMKKGYYYTLMDLLPDVIELLVKYGHLKEVMEIRDDLYEKIIDPDFIKVLRKEIEKDNSIKNIKLLPIIISNILMISAMQEKEDKENDPNAAGYDVSDLVELSKLIMKKKIKKLVKKGLNEDVAFDVLSVIPDEKAITDKQFVFRFRTLMQTMYEDAKTHAILFDEIIDAVIPEKYHHQVITYCLLERRDKLTNFTDKQTQLFTAINTSIFTKMEAMDKRDIENILNTYIESRKRDALQNRDSQRRFALKSLPESEFPKIKKIVDRLAELNPDADKYL